MASEDAVYRQSTQYRLWSFSPSQLDELRTETNNLARESIGARRESTDISFLTPAEEKLLLDFYTVELLRAGQFTGQPTDVQATAAVFLRRFYVTHSVMTYPPSALFKTALFFGAKAEGVYHKLDAFAEKFPHTTAADVLAGEFLLCQGLRFAFDVKHPFRGLEGAVMELRRMADVGDHDPELSDDRLNAAHKRARDILKFSPLVTDAYFHYTPSQIMLAALSLADAGLVDRLLGATFAFGKPDASSSSTNNNNNKASKWERASGSDVQERIRQTLAGCRDLLSAEPPERFTAYWGQPESNNIIKPLLKKLKACRDPDRYNLVALQQAKKEGAVKSYVRATDKSNNNSSDDGAVFGSKIGTVIASASASNNNTNATNTPDSTTVHDAKRRKVVKGLDDPFGPPL